MTPLLPRAPINEPRTTAVTTPASSVVAARASTTAVIVSCRFVPVSPSGTGKTLSPSISSRACASRSRPVTHQARSPAGPSACSTVASRPRAGGAPALLL